GAPRSLYSFGFDTHSDTVDTFDYAHCGSRAAGPEHLRTSDKVLVTSVVIVALTTPRILYLAGRGTILDQFIEGNVWMIVAHLSSAKFADLHHSVVWLVALVLNVVAFFVLAVPAWAVSRNRAPKFGSVVTICLLMLYVGMLFFVFPASDGP